MISISVVISDALVAMERAMSRDNIEVNDRQVTFLKASFYPGVE